MNIFLIFTALVFWVVFILFIVNIIWDKDEKEELDKFEYRCMSILKDTCEYNTKKIELLYNHLSLEVNHIPEKTVLKPKKKEEWEFWG